MASRFAFSRFIARQSFVHGLDPRMKLTLTLALFVVILCAFTPAALTACAVFAIAAYAAARITPRELWLTLWPLLLLVAATALLNVLFVQGGTTYFQWGIIAISEKGIASALFLGVRLMLLLLVVSLLTITTSTFDITAALEAVLKPLELLRVPVHELAMMMGLALRFLPQFAEELRIIYRSQASRAATLSFNPFKGGFSTIASLTVPLFASAFRHSDTLAFAMDARCYRAGSDRTRLHPFAFSWRDWTALAVVGCMTLCVIALDVW